MHNVGVVYSRLYHPVYGSDAEIKMVKAISKNQYSKSKENESSLKDVLKLEESKGLNETIRHLRFVPRDLWFFFSIYNCVSRQYKTSCMYSKVTWW